MLLQDGRDDSNVDDNNNSCVATKLEHYKGIKMMVLLIHLSLHSERKDQKYLLLCQIIQKEKYVENHYYHN